MEVELPDSLTDAFLKQLKTGEELDAHLGYDFTSSN